MFKKLITIASVAALFVFAGKVQAQTAPTPINQWRFGIGAETGVTTGNLHDLSKITLGGTARLQYDLNQFVSFTLTSGFDNAFGKIINSGVSDVKYPSLGLVPVKAGVKLYGENRFYLSGEAGVAFETSYNKDAKLDLSPGIGYSFPNVDLSVHYDYLSGQQNPYGILAIRLAYGFKL